MRLRIVKGLLASASRLASEVAAGAKRPGAARLLFLDLDGTLAPIVSKPSLAEVPPAALASLRRLLRTGWRVAIVSGRPARQARRMVPVQGLRVFGSHGLEGDGHVPAFHTPATRSATRRLRALIRPATRLARAFPGALLEIKPAGVAFHDRRIPRRRLGGWKAALEDFLGSRDLEGIECLRGKRVLELRPAGVNKGSVIRALAPARPKLARDASLVAIGDDTTDEDMFEALGKRGISVRVGPVGKRTRASRRLASPASVARFLSLLAEEWSAVQRQQGAGRRRDAMVRGAPRR